MRNGTKYKGVRSTRILAAPCVSTALTTLVNFWAMGLPVNVVRWEACESFYSSEFQCFMYIEDQMAEWLKKSSLLKGILAARDGNLERNEIAVNMG